MDDCTEWIDHWEWRDDEILTLRIARHEGHHPAEYEAGFETYPTNWGFDRGETCD